MASYYDYVLGFIPVALLGLTALLSAAGVSLTTAVPLGAGVSLLAVGHALFVRGPVDTPDVTTDASSPVQGRASHAPVNAD